MHQQDIKTYGKPIEEAEKVLIMLHGRGATAADILSLSQYLNVQDFAFMAPEATNHTWYPFSFMAPPQQNEPWLSSALDLLANIEKGLTGNGIATENIYFLGFSQGACLTLEYTTRNAKRYGGVAAFTGGLIGDKLYEENYRNNFEQTPIYIGSSDPDPHVPVERVKETENILKKAGANSTVEIFKNMGHTVIQEEIDKVNEMIFK